MGIKMQTVIAKAGSAFVGVCFVLMALAATLAYEWWPIVLPAAAACFLIAAACFLGERRLRATALR